MTPHFAQVLEGPRPIARVGGKMELRPPADAAAAAEGSDVGAGGKVKLGTANGGGLKGAAPPT